LLILGHNGSNGIGVGAIGMDSNSKCKSKIRDFLGVSLREDFLLLYKFFFLQRNVWEDKQDG
jgi:hypothetical protein